MRRFVAWGFVLVALAATPARAQPPPAIENGPLRLELDARLHTRLVGAAATVRPSDLVVVRGREVTDFAFTAHLARPVRDAVGTGTRHEVTGRGVGVPLDKELSLTSYDAFPGLLIVRAAYVNTGKSELRIDRWVSRRHLDAAKPTKEPAFWSFQPGSYSHRPDWVVPVKPGFSQRNFLGMNASDYGGGTPVADVWRRDLGVAVGELSPVPRQVALPVKRTRAGVAVALEETVNLVLAPGERLTTPDTFVAVHVGDHFRVLGDYRRLMIARGMTFPAPPASAYTPIWCGWGYERGVTLAQMRGTLAKAKELGLGWAVLDDGWQAAVGDWAPASKKFPGGAADMQALTAEMRAQGLLPMLWWAPLAAVPGSRLLREHPDFRLLDARGRPVRISWWDADLLCPAYQPVRAYTSALVADFVGKWGYEGLKLDGQHLNGVPPCHNPAHRHAHPTDAVTGLPGLFAVIDQAARAARPGAVIELCPCGTAYAFHSLPHATMAVASDPGSSWQIRSKGKSLKALLGASAPYFGDHVELSTGGDDFASTIGVGGIVGTQFTLAGLGKSPRKYHLTPAKEQHFRKFIALYNEKRLGDGVYRGELYDLGFDRPEAHAIAKSGRMYYAFFTDKRFKGEVELRGLDARTFLVRDYANDRELGRVTGPTARLAVDFTRFLLLEAIP